MLTSRHYTWLALAFLALAAYGSLVPFAFQPIPCEAALARFREICSEPVTVKSRSDWVANILLFFPVGFSLAAALAVDRPRRAGLFAAVTVVPLCVALSVAIEFAQLYFPPRVPSVNDIAAESVGGALGALLWLAAGQKITVWARKIWLGVGRKDPAVRLLPAYLGFLLLVSAQPFDLTISPVEVYHKYKEGRIGVFPLADGNAHPPEAIQNNLANLFFFLPAGLLLAGLPGTAWRQRRTWLRVLALGCGMAAVIEGVQLFVWSRYTNVTDVITGGLAVLAGWVVGLSLPVPEPPARLAGAPLPRSGSPKPWPKAATWGLLLGLLGVLIFINWQPFDFRPAPGTALIRLRKISLIPFLDYYKGDYLHAFNRLLEQTLFFVPVGVLFVALQAQAVRRWPRTPVWRAALLAAVLEAGQLFLPSRYPSLTDVLVAVLGAWIGAVLAGRVFLRPAAAGGPGYAGGPLDAERALTICQKRPTETCPGLSAP